MSTTTHTVEVLQAEVDEGWFTKGAQVSAVVNGTEVLDLALGDAGNGAAVATDTVFRVYCTIKPVAAVALARQVDAGEVDLDEPLDRRFPDHRALADGQVTLRHVLTHTAGLHRPMAIEVETVVPAKRDGFLAGVARPPGWQVGRQAAYSEFFGWHLIGRVLEQVSGQPLYRCLRAAVLDPLGLDDTWVGMTDEDYDQVLPRLGVNFDLRSHQPFPMLLERGRRLCTDVNPSHGGYTTAQDLARFYAAVLAQLAGAQHPALPSAETLRTFTTVARPELYDEVLDRRCGYGLGFMTGLAEHAFGRWCSPGSFGHSGNVGSSFAFADPDRGLAAAVVFNGVVDHESAFVRRPAVVRAIYADLERAATQPEPDPVPTRRRRFSPRR